MHLIIYISKLENRSFNRSEFARNMKEADQSLLPFKKHSTRDHVLIVTYKCDFKNTPFGLVLGLTPREYNQNLDDKSIYSPSRKMDDSFHSLL